MTVPVPVQLRTRPFGTAAAVAAGLDYHHLRGRRFRRLFRDVYVCTDIPDSLELWCDAASLLTPAGAAFSHGTAAQLFRLPVPPALVHRASGDSRRGARAEERSLHVTVRGPEQSFRCQGITVHQSPLPPVDLCRRDGRQLTTPARTYLDLAGSLGLFDLVVLGDAMLNRGLVRLPALSTRVQRARRRRGVMLARRTLPLLEARAKSPAETKVRLHIVLAGLPRPEANVDVFDEAGQWVACPDLLYRAQRVAIEYDGEHHYVDARQRREDVVRNEMLSELGFEVVVLNSVHLRQPHRLVARVAAALSRHS